ncbi:MAG: hypothetical protein ABIY55_29980 [Kofleriaceae bacterium]
MMKLSLAVTLLFAVACKTETPAPSANAAPAGESTGRARSAKIDIKPVAPPAAARADAPQIDPAAREAWRERREAKIDTDGDGKISEQERAAAMHDRVVNMHARLDTDGDGKLTPAELSAGRARMRFDDPAALDTNHDGDISADELAAAMKMKREQRDQRRAANGAGGEAAAPTTTP